MTAKQHKALGNLVEQKILEFFGDPDSGLSIRKSFLTMLNKRSRKTQILTANSAVLKKYGVS